MRVSRPSTSKRHRPTSTPGAFPPLSNRLIKRKITKHSQQANQAFYNFLESAIDDEHQRMRDIIYSRYQRRIAAMTIPYKRKLAGAASYLAEPIGFYHFWRDHLYDLTTRLGFQPGELVLAGDVDLQLQTKKRKPGKGSKDLEDVYVMRIEEGSEENDKIQGTIHVYARIEIKTPTPRGGMSKMVKRDNRVFNKQVYFKYKGKWYQVVLHDRDSIIYWVMAPRATLEEPRIITHKSGLKYYGVFLGMPYEELKKAAKTIRQAHRG